MCSNTHLSSEKKPGCLVFMGREKHIIIYIIYIYTWFILPVFGSCLAIRFPHPAEL